MASFDSIEKKYIPTKYPIRLAMAPQDQNAKILSG